MSLTKHHFSMSTRVKIASDATLKGLKMGIPVLAFFRLRLTTNTMTRMRRNKNDPAENSSNDRCNIAVCYARPAVAELAELSLFPATDECPKCAMGIRGAVAVSMPEMLGGGALKYGSTDTRENIGSMV